MIVCMKPDTFDHLQKEHVCLVDAGFTVIALN